MRVILSPSSVEILNSKEFRWPFFLVWCFEMSLKVGKMFRLKFFPFLFPSFFFFQFRASSVAAPVWLLQCGCYSVTAPVTIFSSDLFGKKNIDHWNLCGNLRWGGRFIVFKLFTDYEYISCSGDSTVSATVAGRSHPAFLFRYDLFNRRWKFASFERVMENNENMRVLKFLEFDLVVSVGLYPTDVRTSCVRAKNVSLLFREEKKVGATCLFSQSQTVSWYGRGLSLRFFDC